jgi:hypothetical protein
VYFIVVGSILSSIKLILKSKSLVLLTGNLEILTSYSV